MTIRFAVPILTVREDEEITGNDVFNALAEAWRTNRRGEGFLAGGHTRWAVWSIDGFLRERRPRFWGIAELDNELCAYTVIEGVWSLLRIAGAERSIQEAADNPPEVLVTVLGKLAGGDYSERWWWAEDKHQLEVRYEHNDVPGRLLDFHLAPSKQIEATTAFRAFVESLASSKL